MSLREIVPGIYTIEGLKMGRSYLIDGGSDGITLIDSSTGGVADRIIQAFDEIRRPAWALQTIIATHYHYDHTGNVQTLRERTGAAFCAHVEDTPYIDGRMMWMAPRVPFRGWAERGVRRRHYTLSVDRTLTEGDVLPVAGGLHVVHAPGHTPGHIALYAKEWGVLFSGDAFMNAAGLRLPVAMSTHDMAQARASIRKLAGLEFEHALPGHGQPVLSRASEKLGEWSRSWLDGRD